MSRNKIAFLQEQFRSLEKLKEPGVSDKPLPGKWSKKEILGHLCDSAINNYYRFMHLQHSASPYPIVPYRQEDWVRLGDYQNRNWTDILEFWWQINMGILRILQNSPPESWEKQVVIDDRIENYRFLVDDYFAHLEHHLRQIL